jgi:phosphopantothenoylcysteine decarboxylase/phosphopantothenate--cysteine ligase
MGMALCTAALARGHTVTLVLGPVRLQPPEGAEVIPVESAAQMHEAVLRRLARADIVICAAAVSDYRVAQPSARKLKRGRPPKLELIENPDIAADVGARKGDRTLVIYALESDDAIENAQEKLERKNADYCVVNGPETIGAPAALFHILRRDGSLLWSDKATKEVLAGVLMDELGL